MNGLRHNRKFAFLVVVFVLTPSMRPATQQSSIDSDPTNKPLEAKVREFQLDNETILDGLWKLARSTVPFGFGFEKILKTKLADPELPDPKFSFRLEGKSIREILDALCQTDARYAWSVDTARVNVYPLAVVVDPTHLLNRKLAKFRLSNASDVQKGLFEISRQLPPPFEQLAVAQVGGGDPYPPEPWTVTLSNVTVRQVINRLAAHGGPNGIWIFGGAKDFRAFGFFNTHPSPWLEKTVKPPPPGAQP
ncbi:MAG: hypothetical protein WCE61_10155 [Candidatus Acidiferrum sp.]